MGKVFVPGEEDIEPGQAASNAPILKLLLRLQRANKLLGSGPHIVADACRGILESTQAIQHAVETTVFQSSARTGGPADRRHRFPADFGRVWIVPV